MKTSTRFMLAIITLTHLLHADTNTGETKETEYQGVQQTFNNTTTLKIKDIPSCDVNIVKSTVFTSKINYVCVKKDNNTFYIKEGIESGVKICLDKNGDLKIYSYKNNLYNKSGF